MTKPEINPLYCPGRYCPGLIVLAGLQVEGHVLDPNKGGVGT